MCGKCGKFHHFHEFGGARLADVPVLCLSRTLLDIFGHCESIVGETMLLPTHCGRDNTRDWHGFWRLGHMSLSTVMLQFHHCNPLVVLSSVRALVDVHKPSCHLIQSNQISDSGCDQNKTKQGNRRNWSWTIWQLHLCAAEMRSACLSIPVSHSFTSKQPTSSSPSTFGGT